ncbi:cell division protein ZapA [Salipiger sp. IMCC34102]|uniref:cell division protein ZapA n=1 Tax=Salipiger sp. IMCC34102 TaxID=2510647 RepID=UPI00101D514C|nr:cell division protein ZapA [Salipiger sp. IMCC34102]RYH03004.1 cell division protein ZapA [Salipiger sp. IMCC34102]
MAQVTITIDGRTFEVACEAGQEDYLHTAARLLDNEASEMSGQIGRMSESRMLLMAGLMLADRFASLADRTQTAEAEVEQLRAQLDEVRARVPERVEVPAIPQEVTDSLSRIAARAEAIAEDLERTG